MIKLKSIPLYLKILIGMFVGVLLGFSATACGVSEWVTDWVQPWGTVFIRLLKLVAIPIVIVSLIKGVSGLKDLSRLSRMGIRTVAIYLGTTVLAIAIGLLMVHWVAPGTLFPREKADAFRAKYEATVSERNAEADRLLHQTGPLDPLVELVPENIVEVAADNTKMLQIIFVTLLFGVALVAIDRQKSAIVVRLFDALNDVMLKVIDIIMLFAPWGVLALMAGLVVDSSGDSGMFKALGLYAGTVVFSLLFLIVVLYPLLIHLFTRVKVREFFKAAFPVQLLAFSTSSSAATLPVTLEQTERELNVPNEVASFVLPVGVTINMDGTSCYQAIAALFIAQVMGIDLSWADLLTIVLMTTLSSIGTPGVPGGSVVMLVMVLTSVGIPSEGLVLILGIDRPLDMLRTVVNVTGDMTVSCLVARTEEKRETVYKE